MTWKKRLTPSSLPLLSGSCKGPYQGRKLSFHIFNPSPRESTDFPKIWVWAAYWAFYFCRRESAMTMTHLFFFMKAVLKQAVADLNSAARGTIILIVAWFFLQSLIAVMQGQLGRWGSQRGDAPAALGRNLLLALSQITRHCCDCCPQKNSACEIQGNLCLSLNVLC